MNTRRLLARLTLFIVFFPGWNVVSVANQRDEYVQFAEALNNGIIKGLDSAVPGDMERAVFEVQKLASSDNSYAQVTLSSWYLKGKHLPEDKQLGLHWLERAVANGNEVAFLNYGLMMLAGELPGDAHMALTLIETVATSKESTNELHGRKAKIILIAAYGDKKSSLYDKAKEQYWRSMLKGPWPDEALEGIRESIRK